MCFALICPISCKDFFFGNFSRSWTAVSLWLLLKGMKYSSMVKLRMGVKWIQSLSNIFRLHIYIANLQPLCWAFLKTCGQVSTFSTLGIIQRRHLLLSAWPLEYLTQGMVIPTWGCSVRFTGLICWIMFVKAFQYIYPRSSRCSSCSSLWKYKTFHPHEGGWNPNWFYHPGREFSHLSGDDSSFKVYPF